MEKFKNFVDEYYDVCCRDERIRKFKTWKTNVYWNDEKIFKEYRKLDKNEILEKLYFYLFVIAKEAIERINKNTFLFLKGYNIHDYFSEDFSLINNNHLFFVEQFFNQEPIMVGEYYIFK